MDSQLCNPHDARHGALHNILWLNKTLRPIEIKLVIFLLWRKKWIIISRVECCWFHNKIKISFSTLIWVRFVIGVWPTWHCASSEYRLWEYLFISTQHAGFLLIQLTRPRLVCWALASVPFSPVRISQPRDFLAD